MKRFLLIGVLFSFSLTALGQAGPDRAKAGPRQGASPIKKRPAAAPQSDAATEKAALDAAIALETPSQKVAAIQSFLKRFPTSGEKVRAMESLTGARAALADQKFEAGDAPGAAALFREALANAPKPYSDRFFAEVISRIPANLYFRGSREEAFAAATSIEQNIGSNINQLMLLANFYLSVEDGEQARRIAESALKLDPDSVAAHLLLGSTRRMNFDLDGAAKAFARALEIEPASLPAKRGLAEMKRSLGEAKTAVDLYREILDKYPNDHPSRTGLVLALFGEGKRQEAETEMAKAAELGTGSVVLVAGAAYWYATHGDAGRGIELGRQAVAAEPRYIWGHLALARALMAQQNPIEAERVLMTARRYGNFPTLDYEIANARQMAGFYREAAEALDQSFTVTPDGVETRLGGRVSRREKSFTELVSYERRASIFEPASSDTPESAERLRTLLDLHQKLEATAIDEATVAAAADAFVKGEDKMKLHRQIYAADALLRKRAAPSKVLELTRAAIGNTDQALDVPVAASAVMAGELYESRTVAFTRGEYLLMPDVPRPALSAILRGRIEELAGWALYDQKNYPDAVIRLRRAVSVYPAKSAWWRSGMWRLGSALEADGKDKEALESYIKSYKIDKPDVVRYGVVENLYRKVNGSLEGLEAQVGANPLPAVTAATKETISPPTAETPVNAASPTEEKPAAAPVTTDIVKKEAGSPAIDPERVPIAAEPGPEATKADEPKIEVAAPDIPKTEVRREVNPATTSTELSKPVSEPTVTETVADVAPVQTEVNQDVDPPVQAKEPVPASTPTPVTVVTDVAAGKAALAAKEIKPASPIDELSSAPAASVQKSAPQTGARASARRRPVPAVETSPLLFEPIIITIPNNAPARKAEPEPETRARQEIEPCVISVSDESVSLINDGGSIGILITVKGGEKDLQVAAASSSPDDLEVKRDLAAGPERRFYTIKSISSATGLFEVNFTASCGKASVSVKVR